MHENSKAIFQQHCIDRFQLGMLVLECGPGYPTPHWYQQQLMARDGDKHRRWETVDVNSKRNDAITYFALPHGYPMIDDGRYDIVFSSMVVEHTPLPWLWFRETVRVCRQDGLIICIAPFVGPRHGDDYWRVTDQGLRALAEHCGLKVEHAETYEIARGDWRGPDTRHVDSLLIARKP